VENKQGNYALRADSYDIRRPQGHFGGRAAIRRDYSTKGEVTKESCRKAMREWGGRLEKKERERVITEETASTLETDYSLSRGAEKGNIKKKK